MALSHRENYLRMARFEGPEWMPCAVAISGATWTQLRGELEDVLVRHPILFPGFEKGQRDWSKAEAELFRAERTQFTDNWGCVWGVEIDGLEGIVYGHPLDDWSKLDTWRAPDPLTQADRAPMDWETHRRNTAAAKEQGSLTAGGMGHGFLFMRLYYLRGFENLMVDIGTDEPKLQELIGLITDHTEVVVRQWLGMGVDVMEFAEDLGLQDRSALSPAQFAKWVTPAYQRVMQPCRGAGALVALHSDGHVMELMDEFIRCGVDIINPQDLVNGIDNLAREVKGRMCIRLDIDRQSIVPFGTRQEIHDLIEEEVRKLGSPQGGLEMICGVYPPTPAENVDALCEAMEEFRTWWWDGRGG